MMWLTLFLVRAAGMFTYVHWICQCADLERLGDISDEFTWTGIIAVSSAGEGAGPRGTAFRSEISLRAA
eukprot:5079996-Pyramimonas_sp.AAC.1